MSNEPIEVVTVMSECAWWISRAGDGERGEELFKAKDAASEVFAASARTIRAFEALGKTSGWKADRDARQECEAALIAQKAASDKVKI